MIIAELLIFDKKKNKIIHKQKANSLIKQFWQALFVQMTDIATVIKAITGSTFTATSSMYTFRCNGGAGNTSLGIVVGSGSTAVNPEQDYKLEAQITAGLSYGANSISYSITQSFGQLQIARDFTNISNTNITINEVGIYAYCYSTSYIVCLDRSVLSSSIILEPDDIKGFIYRLRQTF